MHLLTAKIVILHVVGLVTTIHAHLNHVTGTQITTVNTRGGMIETEIETGTGTETETVKPTALVTVTAMTDADFL